MRTNPQFWVDPRVYNIPGGDYIQIESPEQFVPFWLAFTTPVLAKYAVPVYRYTNAGFQFHAYIGSLSGTDYSKVAASPARMEKMIQELNSQLQHPSPTKYRVCFAHIQAFANSGGWQHNSHIDTNHMVYCLDHDYISRIHHYLPGMYGIFKAGADTMSPTRGLHASMSVKMREPGDSFMPAYVLVVRAKHIPYLRARSHMQLPWELEAADMKLIMATDLIDSSMVQQVMKNSGIKELVRQHGLTTEHKLHPDLMEYMWKPFGVKDKATLLKDAETLAEESLEPYLEQLY